MLPDSSDFFQFKYYKLEWFIYLWKINKLKLLCICIVKFFLGWKNISSIFFFHIYISYTKKIDSSFIFSPVPIINLSLTKKKLIKKPWWERLFVNNCLVKISTLKTTKCGKIMKPKSPSNFLLTQQVNKHKQSDYSNNSQQII